MGSVSWRPRGGWCMGGVRWRPTGGVVLRWTCLKEQASAADWGPGGGSERGLGP